ncbi:MAG: hypothetical protein DWQ05_06205 [Calditrichaeota bacterium]|nr:MAG: hypothetical protein DWQ05_06205 [Calditrichota bacterium]
MKKSTGRFSGKRFSILWDHLPAEQLKMKLNSQLSGEPIDLKIEKVQAHGAIADPTVLVALVSGGSAALTAIIVGIFKLLEHAKQRIIIQAEDGSRLEIPGNTSAEKIDELITAMHKMSVKRIRITDQ